MLYGLLKYTVYANTSPPIYLYGWLLQALQVSSLSYEAIIIIIILLLLYLLALSYRGSQRSWIGRRMTAATSSLPTIYVSKIIP